MVDIRDTLYIPGVGFLVNKTRDQSLGSAEADFAALMKQAEAARQAAGADKSAGEAFSRKRLTKEDAKELAEKYDPSNMTQEAYDSLLDELVEKSVLQKKEMGYVGYHGLVKVGEWDLVSPLSRGGAEVYTGGMAGFSDDLFRSRYNLAGFGGDALAMIRARSLWEPANDADGAPTKSYDANTALLNALKAIQNQRQK